MIDEGGHDVCGMGNGADTEVDDVCSCFGIQPGVSIKTIIITSRRNSFIRLKSSHVF